MPDYSIDPSFYAEDECAWCGEDNDLVAMHVRNAKRGGVTTVPGCRGCNSSMNSSTIKDWLRRIRDVDGWRWQAIVDFHWGRRTAISRVVRQVRDE